MKIERLPCG